MMPVSFHTAHNALIPGKAVYNLLSKQIVSVALGSQWSPKSDILGNILWLSEFLFMLSVFKPLLVGINYAFCKLAQRLVVHGM